MPDEHQTEIHDVHGPVHTGSGDINITGDQSVTSAEVRGAGAIAQGYRSAAAAPGGLAISGDVGGDVHYHAPPGPTSLRQLPPTPDAQIYLDLKGTDPVPLTSAQAMAHVVRAYHPTASLPDTTAELAPLYRSVLHGQQALLLMDNAGDAQQVEPLLPPPSCLLLVTSRRHFALPGLHPFNLDTLPAPDARKLLLKIAPRIGAGCAAEIADLCGCLPIALRLAATTLAERIDLSPSAYLDRLRDAQTRLDLIDASIALSYDLLAEDLRHLWCRLSVFPSTFDAAAAAAVWELEPDPARDALGELLRYSLISWNADTERYNLHDLLRLFAYDKLRQTEDPRPVHRLAAVSQHLPSSPQLEAVLLSDLGTIAYKSTE